MLSMRMEIAIDIQALCAFEIDPKIGADIRQV